LFAGYSYLPEQDPIVKDFLDPGRDYVASLSVNLGRHMGVIADFADETWEFELVEDRAASPL